MAKSKGKRECIEKALQKRYVEGDTRYTEDQCVDRMEFARDQCLDFILSKFAETPVDTKEINMGQDILSKTLSNLTMLRRKEVKDGFAAGMKIHISFDDDEEAVEVKPENHVADAIAEGKAEFEESK